MGITTQQQALILPAAALGSMQPLQRLRCPRGGCLPSKPRDRGMAGSCVPQSWPQRIKPPRRRRCSRCRSHATACGTAGSRQSCGGGEGAGRGGARATWAWVGTGSRIGYGIRPDHVDNMGSQKSMDHVKPASCKQEPGPPTQGALPSKSSLRLLTAP
jgi:hypothetical protein